MARLCFESGPFDAPNRGVRVIKILLDGLAELRIGLRRRLRQMLIAQGENCGLGRKTLMLVTIHREVTSAAAAAEHKLRVRAHRVITDKIEFAPERIEFLLSLFIENQFDQRRIVAEIAEQTVQPRAEVTLFVHRSDRIKTSALA